MVKIKNMSGQTEFTFEQTGKTVIMDFSDMRFSNRVLHLIKNWRDVTTRIQGLAAKAADIKDELDKAIFLSDGYVTILEDFKNDINSVFGFDIVSEAFGNGIYDVPRYAELFDTLTPFVLESQRREKDKVVYLNKKYGIADDSVSQDRVEI